MITKEEKIKWAQEDIEIQKDKLKYLKEQIELYTKNYQILKNEISLQEGQFIKMILDGTSKPIEL